MSRARWDFGYAPVSRWLSDDDESGQDLVIALSAAADGADVARALRVLDADARVRMLIAREPLFWWRLQSSRGLRRVEVAEHLARANMVVRYVASAVRPSLRTAPRFTIEPRAGAAPTAWAARHVRYAVDPDAEGRWFLRSAAGVAAPRVPFRGGAGTRLAVIDDDAAGIDQLELDAEVLVDLDCGPRNTFHGALMVALAVGARRGRKGGGAEFVSGVAPSASPRLYCIPKPGHDMTSLPLAIVRAAADGADVIACATYIEGTTTPMLDDALEFATRLGRRGRGTAVVIPVGRETSSLCDSIHASLSLALADPVSDPRVFAIGPSGREGGWFFWRDRKGRLRPFANRGPAVRWLSPGDDLSIPFAGGDRLGHAESSGASAIAAGVILLLLSANPRLHLSEVDAVLTNTATPIDPARVPKGPLADRHDAEPFFCDRDGHNAKHGYGRLHARRACLVAADPVSAALVAIGEDRAALAFLKRRRRRSRGWRVPYSRGLATWLARTMVADASLLHGAKMLARHVRLVAGHPHRQEAHESGSLIHQLLVLLRRASVTRSSPAPSAAVRAELEAWLEALAMPRSTGARERLIFRHLSELWIDTRPPSRREAKCRTHLTIGPDAPARVERLQRASESSLSDGSAGTEPFVLNVGPSAEKSLGVTRFPA